MTARCKVTFEYEVRPPDTWEGKVVATSPTTIVSRAVKKAQEKLKPRNWQSLVVVILERTGTVSESTESADPAA